MSIRVSRSSLLLEFKARSAHHQLASFTTIMANSELLRPKYGNGGSPPTRQQRLADWLTDESPPPGDPVSPLRVTLQVVEEPYNFIAQRLLAIDEPENEPINDTQEPVTDTQELSEPLAAAVAEEISQPSPSTRTQRRSRSRSPPMTQREHVEVRVMPRSPEPETPECFSQLIHLRCGSVTGFRCVCSVCNLEIRSLDAFSETFLYCPWCRRVYVRIPDANWCDVE